MYKTHITDLDELKHQLRTEWAKLDHVVIATAIHQWRHRSTANIKLTSKTLCRHLNNKNSSLVLNIMTFNFHETHKALVFLFTSEGRSTIQHGFLVTTKSTCTVDRPTGLQDDQQQLVITYASTHKSCVELCRPHDAIAKCFVT